MSSPSQKPQSGPKKPYIVCAFYTPDYAPIVEGLAEGLEAFGLDHHLAKLEPAGGWEANTRLKAQFIADCLGKFPDRDILYLDADARLRQAPALLDSISTDIAIRLFRVTKRVRTWLRPSANTIYFRNTPGARSLVANWVRLTAAAQSYEVDEETLCRAFDEATELTITALPASYAKVFDADGSEPVIEQLQVSRNKPRLLRRTRQKKLWAALVAALGVLGLIAAVLLAR